MKKWLFITGIIAILIAGGYLLLSFYAVKFIQAGLQKAIGPGITLAEVEVKITHLSVRGIQFEDPDSKKRFLQIEEMKVYPELFSILKRRLQIREWTIIKPSFFFYRSQEGILMGPWAPIKKEEKGKAFPGKEEKREGESFRIRVERFRILKGSIDFDDMKTGETPGRIRLRELDLDMRNIQYPIASAQSPVELKGKIKGKAKEGKIYLKGWIDLKTADLETSFQVREVELKTFEPYYRKRVSAEIESGFMNMDATIAVKKKKIDAPGQMELADLHIGEKGTVFYLPAKTLVSLLENKGNRIKVQFHLKGNMDDPRFTLQEAFLTQIAFSLAEALGFPIKGKGTGGLEEGLGLLEELFKKKEKKR